MEGDRNSLTKPAENGEDASPPAESLPHALEGELLKAGMQPGLAEKAVRIVTRVYSQYHSGPLPPAETFAQYEEVCPGAAREILEMAKRSQQHRHAMDERFINSEINYRLAGMIIAAVVVVAMIIAAAVCAYYDRTAIGITMGVATALTTLAGVFIKGRGLFHPEEASEEEAPAKRGSNKSQPQKRSTPRSSKRRRG